MSVAVKQGAALEFQVPTVLFQSPMTAPSMTIDQYGVTRDGQRFLFLAPQQQTTALDPITVVVNWTSGLKR